MEQLLRRSRCNAALARLASGDTAALTDLYDAVGREIFALALSVTGNRHDTEDVMQDTFLRVARSIGTYTPGDGGRAWVLSVARNIALDTVRRRRVSVPLEDGEPSTTAFRSSCRWRICWIKCRGTHDYKIRKDFAFPGKVFSFVIF